MNTFGNKKEKRKILLMSIQGLQCEFSMELFLIMTLHYLVF